MKVRYTGTGWIFFAIFHNSNSKEKEEEAKFVFILGSVLWSSMLEPNEICNIQKFPFLFLFSYIFSETKQCTNNQNLSLLKRNRTKLMSNFIFSSSFSLFFITFSHQQNRAQTSIHSFRHAYIHYTEYINVYIYIVI